MSYLPISSTHNVGRHDILVRGHFDLPPVWFSDCPALRDWSSIPPFHSSVRVICAVHITREAEKSKYNMASINIARLGCIVLAVLALFVPLVSCFSLSHTRPLVQPQTTVNTQLRMGLFSNLPKVSVISRGHIYEFIISLIIRYWEELKCLETRSYVLLPEPHRA